MGGKLDKDKSTGMVAMEERLRMGSQYTGRAARRIDPVDLCWGLHRFQEDPRRCEATLVPYTTGATPNQRGVNIARFGLDYFGTYSSVRRTRPVSKFPLTACLYNHDRYFYVRLYLPLIFYR